MSRVSPSYDVQALIESTQASLAALSTPATAPNYAQISSADLNPDYVESRTNLLSRLETACQAIEKATGNVKKRRACLEMAKISGMSAEMCAKHGDLDLAADLMVGSRALLHDAIYYVELAHTPGAAFMGGIVEGATGLPSPIEGHEVQHDAGKILGSALGMLADGAAFVLGVAGEGGSAGVAVTSVGFAALPAGAVGAGSAALAGAGAVGWVAHWDNMKTAAQAFYDATRVPKSGGTWTSERGESGWLSEKPAVQKITNGKPVRFKNGFPDFTPWVRESVDLVKFESYAADFAEADRLLANKLGLADRFAAEEWRLEHKLTWHHHENCRTMQLLPQELHNATPHQGGMSITKAKSQK
jgi:hypothetical protein